ncbi:transposase [Krasilnikovia sp. M28-CT-15]
MQGMVDIGQSASSRPPRSHRLTSASAQAATRHPIPRRPQQFPDRDPGARTGAADRAPRGGPVATPLAQPRVEDTWRTAEWRRPYASPVRSLSHGAGRDVLLDDLCSTLFASLRRSDQRRKGRQYLKGLLDVEGRKSIRNIATAIGGHASEQSLHHFIASSTWDWLPVRQALTRYVHRASEPLAWVLRPMVIPKVGEHSVGVARRFIPALGQLLNAQHAVGVWTVGEEMTCPVNWALHLSPAWQDRVREVDDAVDVGPDPDEPMGDCTVGTLLDVSAESGFSKLPVVFDGRERNLVNLLPEIRATGHPFLVRINDDMPLHLVDTALAGHRGGALRAGHIMSALTDLRRPVMWADRESRRQVLSLVATARVRPVTATRNTGSGPVAGGGEMALVAIAEQASDWPGTLWLTDLVNTPPGDLFRLTRLVDRVDRDFADIADRVGIRDFAGRSYHGWHRHTTLASAAHAVMALTMAANRTLDDARFPDALAPV